MQRVSTAQLKHKVMKLRKLVLAGPVTVTHNGRDGMVLLSAEEYGRLKRRDREVLTPADFSAEEIEAIRKVQPSAAAIALNHEMDS